MITDLSHTLLSTVLRLAGAPQDTLSKVAARFGTGKRPTQIDNPAPEHVISRLENVFESLSDLPAQPHVAAALGLACDTLQAELPTETVAAGLYDIDSDEVRIVAARGVEQELLCAAVMPRARCLVGYAADNATIARAEAYGADWLGASGDVPVLLCPIRHDANLLGLIALAEPLCAADFSHYDLELVSYVAGQLGTFIQAHRRHVSIAPR